MIWIPGHSDTASNETANKLAKQAVHADFVRPEPLIGITSMTEKSGGLEPIASTPT